MTNGIHRKLLIATLFLGTAAALAACGTGSDSGTNTGAAAPPAAAQTVEPSASAPAAPPIVEPTGTTDPTAPTTSATTPPTRGPAAAGKDDGCPVSAATLLKVVDKSPDIVHTASLNHVECYQGWALAGQVVAKEYYGQVQPVQIMFRYSAKSRGWSIVTFGTGGICGDSDMPASIQKHFAACQG